MDWMHGYYANDGYTFGYYPEVTPARIAWASMVQGQSAPLDSFRYLDLGCGQGFGLALIAATHPDCEFVGVDFIPEHIAHAKSLAMILDLRNLKFIEVDFLDIASELHDLGMFDYVVSHGVSTWVAPEVRQAQFKVISKTLKSGGIFYNSYNTFPGWLGVLPFQHLTLLAQRANKKGDHTLTEAQSLLSQILEGSPHMFNMLPGLQAKLNELKTSDRTYLSQEYNNKHWRPVFVSQMLNEVTEYKLSYLGTANLTQVFDDFLPPRIRMLLAEQMDIVLRETLRDYTVNQSFRRDLYVKGKTQHWIGGQQDAIRNFRFTLNSAKPRPESGEGYWFKSGSLEMRGDERLYGHILSQFDRSEGATLSVSELISLMPAEVRSQGIAHLSLLLQGGWIVPFSEEFGPCAYDVNRTLSKAVYAGAPYRYACTPASGGALPVSEAEFFVLEAMFSGESESKWVEFTSNALTKKGRALSKDGIPINDVGEKRRMLEKIVHETKMRKIPFLKKMRGL